MADRSAALSAPEPVERLAVRLDGFEGPLDLLLDLAKNQKVDLARISILALVEQYLAVIEDARRIRLELAADWLVMAAWLAWLKSRLLLPLEERSEAEEEAGDLLALRLAGLETIRRAAFWLGKQPVLGQDVFTRGQPEDHTERDRSRLVADLPGLIRAFLAANARAAAGRSYTPKPAPVWTLRDAMARLTRMLPGVTGFADLAMFLPLLPADAVMPRRAAYASTFLAGLELARIGQASLRQTVAFGPVEIGLLATGPAA